MKAIVSILFLLVLVKGSVSVASNDPSGWSSYYVTESHEHADAADVVDPSGWNYDRRAKSTVRVIKKEDNSGWNDDEKTESSVSGIKQEDKKKQLSTFCERVLKNEISQTNLLVEKEMEAAVKSKIEALFNKESKTSENNAFVKRFINILLNTAGLSERYMEEGPDVSGIVEIRLSTEHLKRLVQFSNSIANISMRELDSILTASIHMKHLPVFDLSELIEKIFFMASQKEVWLPVILVSIMFCVIRLLLISKTNARFLKSLLILIFIVSYFVEYNKMYRDVEIRQKIILDTHPDIPSSCNPTWWSTLVSSFYFSKESTCEKYHKAVLLDPLLEVSPSRVLSNILTDFIVNPFGKIGTAIAAFSTSIFDGLPFPFNWIVWVSSSAAIFFLIGLVMVVYIGGSVQFQSLFSGVNISRTQSPQITSNAASTKSAPTPPTSTSQLLLDTVAGKGSNFVLMEANTLKTLMLRAQTDVAPHHSGVQDLVNRVEYNSPSSSHGNEKIDLTELQEKRAITKKDESVVITDCKSANIKQEIKREDIHSEDEKVKVISSHIANVREELLVTFEVIQTDTTCDAVDVTFSETECVMEQMDTSCSTNCES